MFIKAKMRLFVINLFAALIVTCVGNAVKHTGYLVGINEATNIVSDLIKMVATMIIISSIINVVVFYQDTVIIRWLLDLPQYIDQLGRRITHLVFVKYHEYKSKIIYNVQ